MPIDPISLIDPTVTNPDSSPTKIENLSPILPRSAWNSQLSYLRAIFTAKKALDRIEQEMSIAHRH